MTAAIANSAMSDISPRITRALSEAYRSVEIAAALEGAHAACQAARDAYAEAEATALDPLTLPENVEAARKDMGDAKFHMDRLSAGVAALNKRLEEALKDEEARAKAAALTAAEKRQVAAAVVLKDRYPVLAAEIAAILAECEAADMQMRRAGGRKTTSVVAGWPGMSNPLSGIKLPMPTGSAWPSKGWGIR